MFQYIIAAVGFFCLALVGFYVFLGPPIDPALLKPAQFEYPTPVQASCTAGEKTGAAGINDGLKTKTPATYNLRTPANYNPLVAHPLIVVFSPAGTSASKSERHVHLTKEATEAGFIIAYADKLRMSLKAIEHLSTIQLDIQNKWCIDSTKIYYTGHSDGGTITNALTFLPSSKSKPTAIAPSAAGMDSESLKQYACPSPLPVMVFHNRDDSHFVGFGKQAADWWAQCNQCITELSPTDVNGCQQYSNCSADGAATFYCESPGSHSRWPNKNHVLINFFKGTY
ncbi:MAG: hypothetical protein JKX87_03570 [Cycloclasticus sp.]|nr:hypothetical protein [Cycloclasticus sp.]